MIVAVSLHKTHICVVKSLVKIAAVSWHSLRRFIKPAPAQKCTCTYVVRMYACTAVRTMHVCIVHMYACAHVRMHACMHACTQAHDTYSRHISLTASMPKHSSHTNMHMRTHSRMHAHTCTCLLAHPRAKKHVGGGDGSNASTASSHAHKKLQKTSVTLRLIPPSYRDVSSAVYESARDARASFCRGAIM